MKNTQMELSGRAWIELVLLGLIWGASFLSIRVALNEMPFVTVVLHRTFWAMLVLWAVVAVRPLPLPREPRVWGAFVVMGLMNNVIPFGVMAWGQLHIESGLTSILNAATAIFGVIVAAVVFADERLTLRKGVGVCLGFLGVATAIGWESLVDFDLRSAAQLGIVGGALSYALAGSWARARLGHLSPVVAAAGMLTGSSAILLPAAWLLDGPVRLDLMPETWIAIGYFSLVGTAAAYLLYYSVLRRAGSGNLMVVTLLIPPVAIVLGAVYLDESLPPSAFLGLGLLAAGLVVLDGRLLRLIDRRRGAN